MTAPGGFVDYVAPVLGYQLPATYELDGIVFGGATDANGCWWIPSVTDGWHGGAKTKTLRAAKLYAAGSFRAPSFRGERAIQITGSCLAVSTTARLAGEVALSAICSDPGKLYTLTATNQNGEQRTADVELDGAPQITVKGERRFDFQIILASPDPRKHDAVWQSPQATLGADTAAGLDASGTGLDASGGGLSAGTPTPPASATVGNWGTAPASPLFGIYGQCSSPTILHVETGASITYNGEVAAGETLLFNCDAFPAMGTPALACLSTVRGNVRPLVTLGTDWPQVDAQASATFKLIAPASNPGTKLVVNLRSAWY